MACGRPARAPTGWTARLRDIVTPPRWRFVGQDGVFDVFAQPAARGRAWVTGDPSATARVVSDSPWGDETIRVDTAPARPPSSARSSSPPGWQATVTRGPAGAAAPSQPAPWSSAAASSQAVTVPAGVHLVHFTYRPARVFQGLAVSAVGVIVVILLVAWPTFVRRRRRQGRGEEGLRSASSATNS